MDNEQLVKMLKDGINTLYSFKDFHNLHEVLNHAYERYNNLCANTVMPPVFKNPS